MTLWSALLSGIGVLVVFRAAFNLYRTVRSYFPTRVRLRDEFHSDWALIVGANSGLGRHLALMVADQHVNIIGAGLSDPYLESTGLECPSRNVEFVPVPVDLMDLSSVSTIIAACESRDVGIVLLNAGLGNFDAVSELDDRWIERYFNLMCTSYSLLVREFLKRNWGRKEPSVIYVTASLAGELMVPRSCLYCATKSYLSRLG
jgi:short-subunit dehydrogenase